MPGDTAYGMSYAVPRDRAGTFWACGTVRQSRDRPDKDAIIAAVKQTKLMTIGGPIDWTKSPEAYSGYENFCTMPSTGGHWVKGKGKYKYDLEIVGNVTTPDIKPTAARKEVSYPPQVRMSHLQLNVRLSGSPGGRVVVGGATPSFRASAR